MRFLAEIRLIGLLAELVVVGGKHAAPARPLEGDVEATDAAEQIDEAWRGCAVFGWVFAEDA